MNRIYCLTASGVLMLGSLAPAHATPKPKNESPSTEARVILEQIDASSANIADTAFRIGALARYNRDPEALLDGLDEIKTDINKIGGELQSLEAERDSLSAWEGKALDQILPLMQDAADNAEKAIQTYTSDRQRLWATSYVDDTARIYKDAGRVATLLRDYLKLGKTREKESRIEQSLGEAQ